MNFISAGINDDEFIRGNVPMTKQEVRIISISRLKLTESSVLFDIGSGTGSVSVECGALCGSLKIFAFEVNPEALELIKKNASKFGCKNITAVEGTAPESFNKVIQSVKPTHAFIGGTSGKLSEILNSLYKLNPSMRVVINAVSLESVSYIMQTLKDFDISDEDVSQISVSKARKAGEYHIMTAQNPVFVFSFNFCKKTEN